MRKLYFSLIALLVIIPVGAETDFTRSTLYYSLSMAKTWDTLCKSSVYTAVGVAALWGSFKSFGWYKNTCNTINHLKETNKTHEQQIATLKSEISDSSKKNDDFKKWFYILQCRTQGIAIILKDPKDEKAARKSFESVGLNCVSSTTRNGTTNLVFKSLYAEQPNLDLKK